MMEYRVPAALRPVLAVSLACVLAAACGADEDRAGGGGAASGGDDPFGNASASGGSGGTDPFGNGGGGIGGSGATGGSGGTGGMRNDECASALVNASKTQPVIMMVIDGSGSMCTDFGGQSRWVALRGALLDNPGGLLYQLEMGVQFGMHMYDGGIDAVLALASGTMSDPCAAGYVTTRMGDCLQMRVNVPPALNNAAAIDAMYPAVELGGSTPTDLAMNEAMDQMIAHYGTGGPDVMRQPHYMILATDGEPNSICYAGLGGDGSAQRQGVIDAVSRGLTAGIQTYVISLAGGNANLQAHLEQVAAAGGTGTMPFTPMNRDDLVNTLAQIIGGAIGCRIVLNGTVMSGQECLGFVEMNGFDIPCNDPNGWVLTDPSTVELQGTACQNFLDSPGAMLRAGFPCGVFTPT